MLRVCLLSARFHPQRSGVGDYTYFLASAVARVGDDVGVLSGGGELDESFYPLPRHMRVHRVVDGWATKGLPDVIGYPRKLDRRVLFNTCPIPLLASWSHRAAVERSGAVGSAGRRAARDRVTQRFGRTHNAARLLASYRELLN